MATIPVNPDILRWARETAGYTLADAARRLHLQAARGIAPEARLEAFEQGVTRPTRPLLLKMSKVYRRPLIAFYLEIPPPKGDRGQDFRRLPEDYSLVEDALIDTLVRDVRARQSIIRAAMEDEDEAFSLPFVGSQTIEEGIEAVCASIRKTIAFDLQEFRAQRTLTDAFAYLRAQTEAVGVFVLLIGDLGSHHSRIAVETFRGFALADAVAPFVVVNSEDARAAWAFTLLHELTHIWLGQTGISGALPETRVEQFCNDAASALLLPPNELRILDVSPTTDIPTAVERINEFANARNISRTMIAYQLFRAGIIDREHWNALRAEFRRLWLGVRADQQREARAREGGPSYYVVRRHRVGTALINLVARLTASGALTSTKAGKILGVKARNVHDLIHTPG